MIYLAAPFFNEKQLAFVESIENVLISAKLDFYSPRSEGVLSSQTQEEKMKNKRAIYDKNIENLDKCDLMVAVIDGRDTGTIWEMGYAIGKGVTVISISNEGYGLNIMLAESVQAHTKSLGEMLYSITYPEYSGTEVVDIF